MTIYQTLDLHGTMETWINTMPYLSKTTGLFLFAEHNGQRIDGHMFPCVLEPGQIVRVAEQVVEFMPVRQEGYYHAKKYGSYYFIQYKDGRWLSRQDCIIDDETIKLYEISNTPVPQSCLI